MELPPELVVILKSILDKRSLRNLNLTCRYMSSATIPESQKHLRVCHFWQYYGHPVDRIPVAYIINTRQACLKHQTCLRFLMDCAKQRKNMSFSTARRNVVKGAIWHGDIPGLRMLCKVRFLKKKDLLYDNCAILRYALEDYNYNYEVARFLLEHFYHDIPVNMILLQSIESNRRLFC